MAAVDTAPWIAERRDDIEKSESDPREYRWLKLTNGMQLMLASDPACDYAAAAMDVGVGSSSDPDALPGLAGSDLTAEAASAFDALDRDGSGTLDYEEFVAMLSGSRAITAAAE